MWPAHGETPSGHFRKFHQHALAAPLAINGGLEFSFDGRAVSFSSYKF